VFYNPQVQAQKEQIELLKQSLERRPNLILTVTPSCIWKVIEHSDGTVETRNETLRLSRSANQTFRLYASNVGDAFSHILYIATTFHCINYTEISIPLSETVILKPQESMSFEYTFDPSHIPTNSIISLAPIGFVFVLGSVETTIQQTITAIFQD
jgi:hypothetical protein